MKNFIIGLVAGAALALGVAHWIHTREIHFTTPFQAVLLDDNQVYYGKLSGFPGANPILTDVYYIKRRIDPQTKGKRPVVTVCTECV